MVTDSPWQTDNHQPQVQERKEALPGQPTQTLAKPHLPWSILGSRAIKSPARLWPAKETGERVPSDPARSW